MEKLTYEKLEAFLAKFEPVSIAWKLHITSKFIEPTTEEYVVAHCVFDEMGSNN
jgi:hypothetical protein